ncbi:ketosteroid isomerase [Mucilaginibacter sp. PAMC 26640]|nr:ketosteroid isomerase [Mucilaginibacter sp. PAMC 26640]
MSHLEIIEQVYNAFNNRDIDGVLTHFHPEVEWPNGWEGGYVHGHHEVRNYWTRQWSEIDPIVNPAETPFLDDGLICVNVKQVIKNLQGQVVADVIVKHIYQFDGHLIKRMTIEDC